LESEAKLFIQNEILFGKFELVWSYILDFENSVNPYSDRRAAIPGWRIIAIMAVSPSSETFECASHIMVKGIKKKDALHLACAITAKC